MQFAFALHALSLKALLSLTFLVALPAAIAVPMAAAARSIGHNAPSENLFKGFGQSFLPLFAIFFVCYFFLFFFEIFAALFLFVAFMVTSAYINLITLDFSAIQVGLLLKGLLACLLVVWLHAWIWAASALALIKFEKSPKSRAQSQKNAPPPKPEMVTQDIRALRKARG